jgi:hypothetical protein
MSSTARTAQATSCLLLAATVLGAGTAGPATAAGSGATPAAGDFTVGSVTFGAPEDVKGNKCKLTVDGTLSFTGDLAGDAVGTTTAIVFATCEEALAAPPGTYFDVFKFQGDFTGTVFGEAAEGTLTYAGVTQEGGDIDARIKLRGDAWAALRTTDAVVLQGGSYSGKAKAPAS